MVATNIHNSASINWIVKITSICIENLLSFRSAKFVFDDYNVIVGPNGAGKTNLLRILKLIASSDSFDTIVLTKEQRPEPSQHTKIELDVVMIDYETRIVLQNIFGHQLNDVRFDETFRRL